MEKEQIVELLKGKSVTEVWDILKEAEKELTKEKLSQLYHTAQETGLFLTKVQS